MTTLRDRVLQLLTDSEKPLTLPKISKALGLTMRQNGEVQRELTILHREKRIHVNRDGGWELVRQASESAQAAPRVELDPPLHPKARTVEDSQPAPLDRRRENLARQRAANTPEARARNRERREAVYRRLELGEASIQQLLAAVPELGTKSLKKALDKLCAAGRIERARQGVYRLATQTAQTAPAERTPHADVRDRLLRGADLVLEGKLSKDGAEALVELVDAILAIDLGAPT